MWPPAVSSIWPPNLAPSPNKPRVLCAGTQESIDRVRWLLGDEIELIPAYSVAEALSALESGADLVLCHERFDDSRMFDFLGALYARPAGARVPVVCCRLFHGPLSPSARRGIALALEALGVAAFVDLYELEMQYGAAAAERALRDIVISHLKPGRK